MFQRFFEKQRLALDERTRIKRAIYLWDNGVPQGNRDVIRNVWPVKIWTELIRKNKIYVNDVDLESNSAQLYVPLLGHIQDRDFWQVVSAHMHEEDPKWDMWMTTALQCGNVAFFEVYPKTWNDSQLYSACTHPLSKKWVIEHPVYGAMKDWLSAWPLFGYLSPFREHLVDGFEPTELLELVRLNYDFEGPDTALRAFDALFQVLEDRNDGFGEYKEVLREIWSITQSTFPFDIVCTLHGKVPLIKDTSAEMYKDCTSVANYGMSAKFWTRSTGFKHHTESTPLEIYLQLTQPGSKEELFHVLIEHYSNVAPTIETVEWDASFGENQEVSVVK